MAGLLEEMFAEAIEHGRSDGSRAAAAIPRRFDGSEGTKARADVLDKADAAASNLRHLVAVRDSRK